MKSKPGSGKRQESHFEIVVNHITINEECGLHHIYLAEGAGLL